MFHLNKDRAAGIVLGTSFLITMALALFILAFLLAESLPVLREEGLSFITGQVWYVAGDIYGALPMIYGTLAVTLLALIIALPLGIGSAVITSEILTGRTRHIVKSLMEMLAAIPGVVYGLIGIALLTTSVRDLFGLMDGNTIFTAGLLLGIMILPTIMTLSDDAMRSLPGELRAQGRVLGLSHGQTIRRVVLPGSIKGITGAVLLGVSRAMGETISVMLVIGSLDRLPTPIYNVFTSGQSITSKLGREGAEGLGLGLQWSALAGLGLMLFISVMALTFTGNIIRGGVRPKKSKNHEVTG